MGFQDSLLEIIFCFGVLFVFCDFMIFKLEDLYLLLLGVGLVDFVYFVGSFLVDYGMFENLNIVFILKFQVSCFFFYLFKFVVFSFVFLGFVEFGGLGFWVGSSQYFKNLGKVMGVKVNDFLWRKEFFSLGSVGVMEINKIVEVQLVSGVDVVLGVWLEDERLVL